MNTQKICYWLAFITVVLGSIISGIAGFAGMCAAQPDIDLIIDPAPEHQRFQLDSPLRDIWCEARVNETDGTYEWRLDGPGEFTTIEGGIGGIYRLPDMIDGNEAQVTITVQFTNPKQETAQDAVIFQLVAPIPTPTPAPTPTPVPLRIRHTFLEQEKYDLAPGETVLILVDIARSAGRQVTMTCKAIKGETECAEATSETHANIELRTITYIAPESPGKDMIELHIADPESDETDRRLIKIEIRE